MAEPNASPRLLEDLSSDAFLQGVQQDFWKLSERVGPTLYMKMFAMDGDEYLLEMQCDSYGDEPILGRFVDPQSLACVSHAWPAGDPTFAGWFKWQPGNLFICWPGDRGGVKHHPEWRQQERWCREENQLVDYLEFISRCLTLPARGYLPRVSQAA